MPVLEWVLHYGNHRLLCLWMVGSYRILGLGELEEVQIELAKSWVSQPPTVFFSAHPTNDHHDGKTKHT